MIIYESFLEKTPLVRKLLGGLSPPPPEPPPPTPYGTDLCCLHSHSLTSNNNIIKRENSTKFLDRRKPNKQIQS